MDQARLVSDELEAGSQFIRRFHQSFPVSAAFWLKAPDDSPWYLYIASDALDDVNLRAAYGRVIELGGESPTPNFDPFQVKLIHGDDPLALAALQAARRSTPSRVTRLADPWFGDRIVEGVYLYPPPALAPTPAGPTPP